MREDWVKCKIEDVAVDVIYGFTDSANNDKVGPKFLRITDIQDDKVNWHTVPYCKCNDEQYLKYSLKNGDLVFARTGATVGKSFLINNLVDEAVFASYLIRIRFLENIAIPKFVKYYFKSPNYWKQITQQQVGIGQPNFNGNKLKKIDFVLPSLTEQRAIVKKIEALFSSLDSGIADLKKSLEQSKIYRQAVLTKAFVGDGNFYNITKVTKDIFAGGDKPLCFSTEKSKDCPIPIFANAVAKKGLYGYTDIPRVTENAVTIAGRGSGTGHLEIREEPYLPIVRLINVIPNSEFIGVKYLYHFLKSITIQKTGSAIPQLTIPTVKEFEIFAPSLLKQTQIVKEIESRLSLCDAVEKQIKVSLQQAEALRQSILKKAFEGRLLTKTELAACKVEKDYEPAAVLLEKIKAEKEVNKAVKKTITKKKA